MASNEKDLVYPSSHLCSTSPSMIVPKKSRTNSILFSCCSCSRAPSSLKEKQFPVDNPSNVNIEEKFDVQRGFFKRIQRFKAQKRQSAARKQQLAAAAATGNIVNDEAILIRSNSLIENENEHLLVESDNQENSNVYQINDDSLNKSDFSTRRIRNSHSIPLLNRHGDSKSGTQGLPTGIDTAYSFTDIEVASSSNDENRDFQRRIPSMNSHQASLLLSNVRQHYDDIVDGTPKSIPSRDFSSMTSNLSAYSTQSLLKKLLDKAQLLNEYYNDVCQKNDDNQTSGKYLTRKRSSSISSGSFIHRDKSIESIRRTRPKRSSFNENFSNESSRFNLYADEDNVLKELIRFNNDIDLILSRLENEPENGQSHGSCLDEERKSSSSVKVFQDENKVYPSDDSGLAASPVLLDREESDPANLQSDELITMRSTSNEINLHLLLSDDINHLRESALTKLLKLTEQNCSPENLHHHQTISLAKLNKLPKSTSWKGKRVFGVPLRVYQQNTGEILPIAIMNALQYVRMNAGKCEGLFRKPGVKSKIDRLRSQIEMISSNNPEQSMDSIKFDDYQPFVVADVIRQYFRELPECLMPPSLTRLLCDLIKCLTQEDQLLAIRYVFLILPDETRDVLETILRFLLDVSIRSGNSQTTCRSLARIFVPSIFQSYHDMHTTSSKILWWKWKKDKLDAIQQESERLTLELCLMTMILNVDSLCRVPSSLSEELKLPTARKTKRLDDLVRQACHGEFHMKKYIAKDSEHFFQRLSSMKFKHVQTNVDGVDLSIHKPSTNNDPQSSSLPTWKCSIDIPNSNVKQISQRITHERYLWDTHFAESRTVEKIDEDKEIVQYVLNFLDLVPVRSFCEFRFSKKLGSKSISESHPILISAISIDHLQNHFLPGSIGQTHEMHYYVAPSSSQPGYTTVTQVARVDFSGRSTQWYENVFGCLLAHNLLALRETFTNPKLVKV